jgi:DNA transposition AAA+ family ATPase
MSEQESEYKIVPFVEEETSQIIKPEGPQPASKYAVLAEEEQKREAQKQFLSEEHKRVKNYEEEMGIRRDTGSLKVQDERSDIGGETIQGILRIQTDEGLEGNAFIGDHNHSLFS